jgi:branched-chain amino acid transport system permease protein
MDFPIFLQTALDGLMISLFYILIALGLTLMFGILRMFNFAHGEVYMMGGFLTYYFYGQFHIHYFLTVLSSLIMGGLLGIVFERLIFRPFRTRPFNGFIGSLGLIWILQTIAITQFGVLDKDVPTVFPGVIKVMGISISLERLGALVIGIVLVIAMYLMIQRTKTGKALRAVAQDMEAASLQGIPVNRMTTIAFALGSALSAGAGSIMSPIFLINPYSGAMPVTKAFIVIILGGMGSLPGTLLGGLLLGFIESFSTVKLSIGVVSALGFGVVILLLLVRPKGLLGRGE